ncbi:MAG: DNA adenine methylase [Anaerolineae bacterium]|nr:DNA adenine methylase [Anaerolineae bacterium]MDH7472509.1 DNA adenine methylase [Anaerolineae bacterium]
MAIQRQLPLFSEFSESVALPRPVNVASVPQRSPFRYPGGKTWFVPTFRRWIARLKSRPRILVEPFAGGGIISLTALFENLVERVVMVELDDEVAAVWETIVNGDAEWLANRILTFSMTREAVEEELQKPPTTKKEKAFQTILKNRTLHGGILAEGSRFIRHGENGKGIGSRWYPKTLAQRLINLNYVVNRIDFRHDDGLKVMMDFSSREDAIYFIDPPYTAGGKKAGKRLYKHHQIDHEYLFTICESLAGDFLMTYDEAEEVKEMARRHGFQMRLIPMKNTHHATMRELIIGRDLLWLDELPAIHEFGVRYNVKKAKKQTP